MKRLFPHIFAIALLGLLTIPTGAHADFQYGLDAGAGPTSTLTNSNIALSSFEAATRGGSETLINFEGLSPPNAPTTDNTFLSLGHAFEVETLNTDHGTPPPGGFQYGLTNTSNSVTTVNNAAFGFSNSGNQHFEFASSPTLGANGSASMTFQTTGSAFQAFGFQLTGLGDEPGTVTLSFQDQGLRTKVITGSPQGGALFLGYTGGTAITSFTLTMTGFQAGTRDVYGIDDIRLVRLIASVPEPSSLILAAMGFGLAGIGRLRRSRPDISDSAQFGG